MEWESPAIVLGHHPFGENDGVATLLTEQQGVVRGLVKGGGGRGKAAVFQAGNVLKARWVGRTPERLGQFTAEMVHAAAGGALADPVALSMLQSLTAVTAGALPERDPDPTLFASLLLLMVRLPEGEALLPEVIRYECDLLKLLGYGLDLSGADLAYVSPRTGRGVSAELAGQWRERLLPLPGFLVGEGPKDRAACLDGLRLTAHFLERDVFGTLNRRLPPARLLLYDLIANLRD